MCQCVKINNFKDYISRRLIHTADNAMRSLRGAHAQIFTKIYSILRQILSAIGIIKTTKTWVGCAVVFNRRTWSKGVIKAFFKPVVGFYKEFWGK